MPGLRPKATPISFDPAASGHNSPTVKSPVADGANGNSKNSTTETEYTTDFGNQNGQKPEPPGELLNAKETQPINSPPPKAAKTDPSPPGSNTGTRNPSHSNVVTLPPVKSATSPTGSKAGSRKNSIQRYPKNPSKPVFMSDGFQPLTLYTDEYKRYPLEMRNSFKPMHKPIDCDDPVEDKTTHRLDYVPHPLGQIYKHKYEAWQKPDGAVDHLTSYVREYPAKKIDRAKGFKKLTTYAPAGKFEGEPTYTYDYKKWTPIPNERKSLQAPYRPPSVAFQGNSNYTSDYITYQLAKSKSLRPVEKPMNSGAFDSTTGYKSEYIKHALPSKFVRDMPKYEKEGVPLEGKTNYMDDYIARHLEKTKSCKPNNEAQNSEDPLEGDTTYKLDYQKWAADRPYQHQHDAWVKPDGEIDFGTTTSINYDHKIGNPAKAIRPVQKQGTSGRFEGMPTYTHDYKKWPMDGLVRVKNDSKYVPSEGPFQGEATYKRDYIGYKEPPRKTLRPIENPMQSGEFDSTTGYKTDYIQHPMAKKEKKETPQWTKNPAALDATTNYVDSYTVKQISKIPSFKPDGGPQMSDEPFGGITTHRDDFQKWTMERPFQHKQGAYTKPDGEFDFNTTHNLNFNKKPIIMAISNKPAPRAMDTGKFQDSTTNRDDFKKWSAQQRLKPIPKAGYVPSDAPFEGFPTYRSDFITYKIPERTTFRPIENTQRSKDPLEDKTVYKMEYIKKEYGPCITSVPEFKSQYTFVGDQAGHKFYEKAEPEPLQRTLTVA